MAVAGKMTFAATHTERGAPAGSLQRRSVVALLTAGALCAISWLAHAAGMQIGQPAPPMVAIGLDGRTFDLGAQHGKVVLVNFWATWCVPCRKEMPLLDAFYRQHRDAGLALIGISVDRPDRRPRVLKVMTAFAYAAAMLSDVTTKDFDPPDGVPSTYVVDHNGVVRDRFIAVDDALLAEVVLPLLSQASAPARR
jgi:cytochrome c biogenesis protein CcmG, thiol:disulfide interchange protein DsbE